MESLRLRIIEAKSELDFIKEKNRENIFVPDLRREYFIERKYKELLNTLSKLNRDISMTQQI